MFVFGSHTFVPISWMCKKQSAVSHSSTESEILSLDTGLRLDGLLALELWDLIVSVFGNISHISDSSGQPVNGKNKSHNKIDAMQDIVGKYHLFRIESFRVDFQCVHRFQLLKVCDQYVTLPNSPLPRTERILGTFQVKLSFQIDGFSTDPSQL